MYCITVHGLWVLNVHDSNRLSLSLDSALLWIVFVFYILSICKFLLWFHNRVQIVSTSLALKHLIHSPWHSFPVAL